MITTFASQSNQLKSAWALLNKEASAEEIVQFVNSLASSSPSSSPAVEMADNIRARELIESLTFLRERARAVNR